MLGLMVACSTTTARDPNTPLQELREQGRATEDADLAAEWLFAELLRPGGSASGAEQARKQIESIERRDSMLALFALGLDDKLHGRLGSAPEHFLGALRNARVSDDPRAPYVAWLAASEAAALRHNAPGLWKRWKPFLREAIDSPQHIGWRARGDLVDWWVVEEWALANPKANELAVRELGCVTDVRLAGPFGLGASADVLRHYPAENPGTWPNHWAPEPGQWSTPKVLETERTSCSVTAKEFAGEGVFYGETFFALDEPKEIILTVQGAIRVWVDDHLVLDRDPRLWGIWPKFGIGLKLVAGRHRVVASLTAPETSVRIMDTQGGPLHARSDGRVGAPYSLVPPQPSGEPNLVSRFIRDGQVVDPKDHILRFLLASLANSEGQGDVANVIFEPLVKDPEKSPGAALFVSAEFTAQDQIFSEEQVRDLVHELHARAAEKDPKLYAARLGLAMWESEQSGPSRAVANLERLAAEFPTVPSVGLSRAATYERLGWRAEHQRAVLDLEKRFPEDPETLMAAIDLHESIGGHAHADELTNTLVRLNPDSEVLFQRALDRADYDAALTELRRLKKRRPETDSLDQRIHAVLLGAAREQETLEQLKKNVKDAPRDSEPRRTLADAELSRGSRNALLQGLVDAVAHGADASGLEEALDLLEGMSELEPYRLDATEVIKSYESRGQHMPGTAARVLDYAAMWIRSDGSSRMLEHEIVRIQSAEGLSRFAEQQPLEGLVLNMRVIKQDGRVLEPEFVAGKPTLTYPHLEVGDYIDTEHVISLSGPAGGDAYVSPQWFFREEDVAYARSEFVVISPSHIALDIEARGNPPRPVIERQPGVIVHRWRVDDSPSAFIEPFGVPLQEVLPSVRVGWGVSLQQRLRSISSQIVALHPLDPRIRRIASRIVEGLPSEPTRPVAQRLFRWVLENVQPGEESDGRRVLISKQGNRWQGFEMLCRALGIPVGYALAKSSLGAAPLGPISESEEFSTPLVRVLSADQETWLTFGTGDQSDKYLPFGYLPAWLRDTEAWTLSVDNATKVRTPSSAGSDETTYEGHLTLDAAGRASGSLTFRFLGATAMQLRGALEYLPSARWRAALESGLVGRKIRGGTIQDYEVKGLDEMEKPLEIRATIVAPNFAQKTNGGLRLSDPFAPRLAKLASQTARETPLLLSSPIEETVKLTITLPTGHAVGSGLLSKELKHGRHLVKIRDAVQGDELTLSRRVSLQAARIAPDQYPGFAAFARDSSTALDSSIQLNRLR